MLRMCVDTHSTNMCRRRQLMGLMVVISSRPKCWCVCSNASLCRWQKVRLFQPKNAPKAFGGQAWPSPVSGTYCIPRPIRVIAVFLWTFFCFLKTTSAYFTHTSIDKRFILHVYCAFSFWANGYSDNMVLCCCKTMAELGVKQLCTTLWRNWVLFSCYVVS